LAIIGIDLATDVKLKKILVDSYVSLVYYHKNKCKDLLELLRDAIVDKSKQIPPIKILINDCYGGFGYNKTFIKFLNGKMGMHSSYFDCRIDPIDHIRDFGKSILDGNKLLERIMYMYFSSNIRKIFTGLFSLKCKNDSIITFKENLTELKRHIDSPYTKRNVNTNLLSCDSIYGNLYHIHQCDYNSLINAYNEGMSSKHESKYEKISEIEKQVKHHISEYAYLNDQNVDTVYSDMKMYAKSNDKKRDNCQESFADYVIENINDTKTWDATSAFTTDAVMYLIDHNCEIKYDDTKMEEIYSKFGLICASDKYCKLKIVEVPALCGWTVHEYDGLENVVIL